MLLQIPLQLFAFQALLLYFCCTACTTVCVFLTRFNTVAVSMPASEAESGESCLNSLVVRHILLKLFALHYDSQAPVSVKIHGFIRPNCRGPGSVGPQQS